MPFAYWLAGDTGRKAAVIHDELYRHRLETRATADAVFYEARVADGVPAWRCRLMWAGVRVGGWASW